MSLEHGMWAPNIHFHNPNPDIPALLDGRVHVVSEPIPVRGGIVGINSFGFGGSNVHIILRPPGPKTTVPVPPVSVPRIVQACGRTEEATTFLLNKAQESGHDSAFLDLLSEVCAVPTSSMPYRGYTLLGAQGEVREVQQAAPSSRPLWYICSGKSAMAKNIPKQEFLFVDSAFFFYLILHTTLICFCVTPSGMGTQWAGMGRSLMQLQEFKESIRRSDMALKDTGLCVSRLLMEADENTFEDTVHAFVGLAAIQVRLPR